MVVLVAVSIVGLRLSTRHQEARWGAFVADWRPLLLNIALGDGPLAADRPLPRRDLRHFLRLWLYLRESVRGEAAQRLDAAACSLGVPAGARRLLARGSRPDGLLAVLALGSLRDAQGWTALLATARSADPLLSVNAARALVQIDPLSAAEQLMPLILSRQDWDASRVAAMLGDARQAFWLLLVKALPTLSRAQLLKGLRLGEALRLRLPAPTLAALLHPSSRPDVATAALALAGEQESTLPAVRALLAHPAWRVRECAARAFGTLAKPSDTDTLARLLADSRFEVRLAAARALATLNFIDSAALARLADTHPSAADVLRHAKAELEWA